MYPTYLQAKDDDPNWPRVIETELGKTAKKGRVLCPKCGSHFECPDCEFNYTLLKWGARTASLIALAVAFFYWITD